jgi:hypothetical protein
MPWLGEGGVGGFAEELHGTGTEPPQGFHRDRATFTHLSRRVMVGKGGSFAGGMVCKPSLNSGKKIHAC